jgi:hypothetical protein
LGDSVDWLEAQLHKIKEPGYDCHLSLQMGDVEEESEQPWPRRSLKVPSVHDKLKNQSMNQASLRGRVAPGHSNDP